jgi:hypothetical protein
MSTRVRLAVVGGNRGGYIARLIGRFPEQVSLAAICDTDEAVLRYWGNRQPQVRTFAEYESLLGWGEFDAVFLATPYPLHARQAIAALEAGKHVLSEVVAATTLEECWALVEAVEHTGRVYMMAENYCYQRPNMMVANMVEQGVFGEIVYAEGAYIHDTRDLAFNADGSLAWRGELHRRYNRNRYPTHSLGPIAQWLRLGRPGGDRLLAAASFASGSFSLSRWAANAYGPDHPAATPGFFRQGDTVVTVLTTEKGRLIILRGDYVSPRPHNMTHYALQGTQASYLAARHPGVDPLVWIEGLSPTPGMHADGAGSAPQEAVWEPLWRYADVYEHPRWVAAGARAAAAGHGGGDFFVIEDFLKAIIDGEKPAIDVYDAVTWSSIIPLSEQSLAAGGAPVAVPDFRRQKANS